MEDFSVMVNNIRALTDRSGPLWNLISYFCYFMAFVSGMTLVMQLKEVGEGGGRMTYRTPTFTFIAMAVFAAIPRSIKSVAVTVYGGAASDFPLTYATAQTQSNASLMALLQFVSLMGYVFFVSGIFTLKKAGQPDRYPQESVGKATVVLISAMCAIYIDLTLKLIASLTGWNISNYIT